jgi:hypothetical protein
LLHQLGQGVVAVEQGAAQAGEGLGLGAGPGRLCCPSGCQVDEGTDDPGDGDEDDQGQQVGLLGDPEPVQRGGEVPVGEQERPDRGDRRRHKPTDHGHDDHQQ